MKTKIQKDDPGVGAKSKLPEEIINFLEREKRAGYGPHRKLSKEAALINSKLRKIDYLKKRDCPSCGVKPGEKHKDGCNIEGCPLCGERGLTCECENIPDGEHRVYTGLFPGTEECLEYGLWCKWEDEKGWVRCDESDPAARPDVGALADLRHYGYLKFDRAEKKWILKLHYDQDQAVFDRLNRLLKNR